MFLFTAVLFSNSMPLEVFLPMLWYLKSGFISSQGSINHIRQLVPIYTDGICHEGYPVQQCKLECIHYFRFQILITKGKSMVWYCSAGDGAL